MKSLILAFNLIVSSAVAGLTLTTPFDSELLASPIVNLEGTTEPWAKVLCKGKSFEADSLGNWGGSYVIDRKVTNAEIACFVANKPEWRVQRRVLVIEQEDEERKGPIMGVGSFALSDPTLYNIKFWEKSMDDALQKKESSILFWKSCDNDVCLQEKGFAEQTEYLLKREILKKSNKYGIRVNMYKRGSDRTLNTWEWWGDSRRYRIRDGILEVTDSVTQFLTKVTSVVEKKKSNDLVVLSGELPSVLTNNDVGYLIKDSIWVKPGAKVKFDPGVRLYFEKDAVLLVEGVLNALGTIDLPISLQAFAPEKPWKGVVFNSLRSSNLSHFKVLYAQEALKINKALVFADQIRVSQSGNYAVQLKNADLVISQSTIDGVKGAGIILDPFSKVSLRGSDILAADVGVFLHGGGEFETDNSTIRNSKMGMVLSGAPTLNVKSNWNFVNNKVDYVGLEGTKFFEVKNRSKAELKELEYRKLLERIKGEASSQLMPKASNQMDLKVEQESGVSINGSFDLIAGYHQVEMIKRDTITDYFSDGDTIQKGQTYKNMWQRPGPYTEMRAYLYREKDEEVLEFNLEALWNEWDDYYFPFLLIQKSTPEYFWSLGDLRVQGTDLLLSSQSLLGAHLGTKPKIGLVSEAYLGELDKPLAIGDQAQGNFGQYIEQGNARAQRILSGAKLGWKDAFWRANLGYLDVRDYRESFWPRGVSLSDTDRTARGEIEGRLAYADFDYQGLGGKLDLRGQFGAGIADSSLTIRLLAFEQWAIENNIIDEKEALKSLLVGYRVPTNIEVEDALPVGLGKSGKDVLNEIEKIEQDLLELQEEDRTAGVNTATPGMAWGLDMGWNHKKTDIDFSYRYSGKQFYSPAQPRQNWRKYSLGVEQELTELSAVFGDYALQIEYVESDSNDASVFGLGNASLMGWESYDSSPFGGVSTSQLAPKVSQDWGVGYWHGNKEKGRWSVKGDLGWNHQLQDRVLRKDTSISGGIFGDSYFAGANYLGVIYGDSLSVDQSKLDNYIAMNDTLASLFEHRLLELGSDLSYSRSFSKTLRVKFALNMDWRWDKSKFHVQEDILDELSNDSWASMGFQPGGENSFSFKIPLSINWELFEIDLKTAGSYYRRSVVRDNQVVQSVDFSQGFNYEILPRVFEVFSNLRLRHYWTKRDRDEFYAVDSEAKEFLYYTTDTTSDGTSQYNLHSELTKEASTLTGTEELPVNYTLKKRKSLSERNDTDLSVMGGFRWNMTRSWSFEGRMGQEFFLRPSSEYEEYNDFWGEVAIRSFF